MQKVMITEEVNTIKKEEKNTKNFKSKQEETSFEDFSGIIKTALTAGSRVQKCSSYI